MINAYNAIGRILNLSHKGSCNHDRGFLLLEVTHEHADPERGTLRQTHQLRIELPSDLNTNALAPEQLIALEGRLEHHDGKLAVVAEDVSVLGTYGKDILAVEEAVDPSDLPDGEGP